MRRIVLPITIIVFTLIFAISAYSHDFTSNGFWEHASDWYSVDTSASRRITNSKFRYMYYDYADTTDTCIGLNIIINDKTKITKTALSSTGFDVNFYNTSGECLDYFQIIVNEGTKTDKGVNGIFDASAEAFNAYNGTNYRFFAQYHSLSKFAQNDKIIVKIQIFDSEALALFSETNKITFSVPRLSLEPETTQKTAKSNTNSSKSKKTDKKSASAKSGSNKKKKYYFSSTTASRKGSYYGSKSKGSYYSSGKNRKSNVSTTKDDSEESETYSKADIISLEENESSLNNKQVIAICVISALAGSLIAVTVLLIIKKKKHNSSIDDNKQ